MGHLDCPFPGRVAPTHYISSTRLLVIWLGAVTQYRLGKKNGRCNSRGKGWVSGGGGGLVLTLLGEWTRLTMLGEWDGIAPLWMLFFG